ncbi:MAG: von Willebrand factor type A domain-containing protein [Chitinophagaceae bacterium]|nr:von Willebrand factor type A domain-containing protein [Chitinophagaceae bacterium]
MKKLLMLIAPVLFVLVAFRPVKSHTVSGTITDESGNPVMGASVMVKGTTTGVAADNKGTYKIIVPGAHSILVFSGAAVETVEVKVKGRSVINVVMKNKTAVGTEVVVTSLGMAKQYKEYGYSTSKIKSSPLNGYISVQDEGDMNSYFFKPGEGRYEDFDREGYDKIVENKFLKATDNPLSTFSIDVDAASYSNVRRFLNQGQLPPAGAVRIEEMVNYFKYEYPQPEKKDPFTVNTEISDAPWNSNHKLVLIGLQGRQIPTDNLPASNLVFLIDVSGSMGEPNKLPLVKASMKLLVEQLREKDKVAMVVYAGAAGLVLPPTSGYEKTKIKDAIDRLDAGGSTAGGAGIKLAYKTARENFVKGGNNRVILCTDGDFNVGESSDDAMERLIEQERKSGVFLTVLGYGMGNYQDAKMQKLADKGNGNHAYIDGLSEAKKVLVNEFGGTLFTIAKDVKLQIEFNPAKVQGYRLIGYENRMLAKEDFNDDKKDAGELGSGHTVTALYEIIPAGAESEFLKDVGKLKYQKDVEPLSKTKYSDEIMTVKLRYKSPDGDVSKLIEHPVKDEHIAIAKTSDNFRFAAAVAQFGLLLRDSEFKSEASYVSVISLAKKAKGNDDEGYRSEFIRLVESAKLLAKTKPAAEGDEETISKK